MVVVDRDLAEAARERDRELAARVDLAEQHVGDGVAGLDAREPGLEDRRRGGIDVRQRQRAAVEEHDDERLARRLDRVDELLLLARQVDLAARGGLTAHARGSRRARARPGRRRSPRRPPPAKPASEPHSSAGVLSGGSLSRIVQPWVNVVFGSCALMPVKTDTASVSLPWPHHGPSMSCWSSPSGPITATDLAGIERQRRAVVLEQHHRLVGRGCARRRGRRPSRSSSDRRPWPGRRTDGRRARRGT